MPAYLPPVNGVSLSAALAEAAAYATTDRVILDTLTFEHPLLASPLRWVNDYANLTATLETGAQATFERCAFSIKLPEQGDNVSPSLTVALNGVSSQAADLLEAASRTTTPVLVTHRVYASDDTTAPAVLPVQTLELIEVPRITDVGVSITAAFGDAGNRAFPRKNYNRTEHPGLAP